MCDLHLQGGGMQVKQMKKHTQTNSDRQVQTGTDRERQGQAGTDRDIQGQTGTDRDRQGQKKNIKFY